MEITRILQHLFNKASLEEVPVEALEQITDQYPYFATGHFLLSKKLKQEGSENFRAGLQKTNLYFHDTLWLHHLLKEDRGHLEAPGSAINVKNLAAEVSVAAATAGASPVVIDSPQDTGAETGPSASIIAQGDTPATQPSDTIQDGNDIPAENPVRPPAENAPGHPVAASEVNQTGRPLENKAVEASPLITFDPYHTIDYFASLGIRLSNEIKPDDRLGNQLKSFTQWLKTMKKLPSGVVENSGRLEPFENARIEKIAAHSLEEKETITEAMAEVLVKQGKIEKAKAVYQKLSLLNPGKIAYFAAKIEELKQY